MKVIESDLKFNGYKIKELKYEQYNVIPNDVINYSITINPEIKFQEDILSALLKLGLVILGKQKEEKVIELSVLIEGIFSTDKIKQDEFKKLVMSNGVATLITILRSFIASFSSQIGNMSPIIMPLINVQASIEDEENLKNKDHI